MPTLSFLAELGRKVNRAKVRRMFEAAELTSEEMEYMLAKHCDRQTREWVHDFLHISPDRQRALESVITDKFLGWCMDNLGEFNLLELIWLRGRLKKRGVEVE